MRKYLYAVIFLGVVIGAAYGLIVILPAQAIEGEIEGEIAKIDSSTPGFAAFPASELRIPVIVPNADDPDRVPRQKVLKALFEKQTSDIPAEMHQERVVRVARWVQLHFVRPLHTPLRPDGSAVYDPLQLLLLRRAQCGQVNRVLLDILDAGGYRGRVVQLQAHQGAEVFYDGAWHYIEGDALTGGQQILKPDGTLPSALEIHHNPQWLDGICLSCEHMLLSEPLTPGVVEAYASPQRQKYNGDAWREVFALLPEYYERKASVAERINDPSYGWLVYVHEGADGSQVSVGR